MNEAEREAKRKLEESIAKRKEENKAKQEQAKSQASLLQVQESPVSSPKSPLAERIRKNREEAALKKQQEEEALRLQKQREAEAIESAKAKLQADISQRKQQVEAAEQQKKAEREQDFQRISEEREKAAAEQKKMIEANKAEALRKKEEEKNAKLAEEQEKKQQQLKEVEERNLRRKQQLEEQKAEKLRQEKEEREKNAAIEAEREAERKAQQEKRKQELERQKQEAEELERKEKERALQLQKELEEQQKEANRKHAEEVKRRKDAEKDLAEEERLRLEAQFAAEFEAEQKKRKEEMESVMVREQERQKAAEEKIKQLGLQNAPVNRCGLFSNFGEEPGLEIWVVGDHQVSKIAKMKHGLRGLIGESYGSFNVQKSYVILQTTFSQGFFHYRLHSWVGSRCPKEMCEQTEERLKELETGLILHDLEVITREYEREESQEFKNYFESELEYVEPVTLRTAVGPNFTEKTLYQIKGRNNIHLKRVNASPQSLNSGDVFVLEDSFGIYQFNGKKSNKMERGKALDFGVQLRIERNARVRVHIIDEGNPQCEHENNKFWAVLLLERDERGEFIVPGAEKSEVTGATPTGLEQAIKEADEERVDNDFEVEYVKSWKFYQVLPTSIPSDLTELENIPVELKEIEIGEKGPSIDLLNEFSVSILDCQTEIFLWYGNFSSLKARAAGREKAKQLKEEATREKCTIITKVRQRTEPYVFKEKFTGNWGDQYTDFDFNPDVRGNIAQLKQEEINIDCMYHPEKYAIASEDKRLPIPNKDPSIKSSFDVYLVSENDKTKIPESEHGIFYSNNCYLIQYELHLGVSGGGDKLTRNVLYFWQGWHSTRDDRGLSALLAGDLAKKLRFCQVERVVQGKEPEHFLSHFPGLIILFGKRTHSHDLLSSPSPRLFQVRGSNEIDPYGVETVANASSLNTNDAFVLVNNQKVFVWNGLGSNDFEKNTAKVIAARISGEASSIDEGAEPSEFWEGLGGKGDYISAEYFRSGEIKAKLFECTNLIGIFKVYEIDRCYQEDLISRNCAILDGGSKVFIWIGAKANEQCVKMTIDTTDKYLNFENEETPKRGAYELLQVKQGAEPLEFKAFFHSWNPIQPKE